MSFEVRHQQPTDLEAIHQLYCQPQVVWGTLQLPYPSIDTWRKRLEEVREGHFSLVATADDELVGHLGLGTYPSHSRRKHAGHLGMAVHDAWQGKGVGTTLMQAALDLADNWLNLLRLELQVFADNEPAIGLYRKLGFETEGTFVGYAFRAGEYVDTYTMARLRGPLLKDTT